MRTRRKSFAPLVIVMGLLFFAGPAFVAPAESTAKDVQTITGQIQGTQGFLTGFQCPADQRPMMAAVESDFVLVTEDGKHYYMPNISANLKVSYLLETVTVKGEVIKDNIIVDEFIWDGKTIWTPEMERKFREEAYRAP